MERSFLFSGNEAVVEGALRAGVRFFAGYPITPSSEIAEILSSRFPDWEEKFIQAEDELAAAGMIIGASLAGVKSMTATSGPGFSLMQENIGFAIMAEVPCVIVDVQRGGPSTGLPTKSSQADVMQARWGRHGDQNIIVLAPSSVKETFDLTIRSVNLSEKYRTPVILLMEEVVAHMREKITISPSDKVKLIKRKKPKLPPDKFLPYKAGKSGIPPMANFGEGYRSHVTGLTHDEAGFPTSNSEEIKKGIRRLYDKIEKNKQDIISLEKLNLEDAEIAVFAYGAVARSAYTAVEQIRKKGIKAGLVKAISLWPFPDEQIASLAKTVKMIIVPEMNLGQMINEVRRASAGKALVVGVNRIDGELITPDEIIAKIEEVINAI